MFRLPLVYPMFWDRPLLHRKNSLRAKVVQLKNDYIKQTIASSNKKKTHGQWQICLDLLEIENI